MRGTVPKAPVCGPFDSQVACTAIDVAVQRKLASYDLVLSALVLLVYL